MPARAATICTPGEETDWIDITDRPAKVHAFTVCYFGSEEFLPETPFVLALVEFEGGEHPAADPPDGRRSRAAHPWIGSACR